MTKNDMIDYTFIRDKVDQYTPLLRQCRDVLTRLLTFNKDLCQEVGVSTHYPSTEEAQSLLADLTKAGITEEKA